MYRIVTDQFCGYEVQKRVFGFLWRQVGRHSRFGTNTCRSIEEAAALIEEHKSRIGWFSTVVKVVE